MSIITNGSKAYLEKEIVKHCIKTNGRMLSKGELHKNEVHFLK